MVNIKKVLSFNNSQKLSIELEKHTGYVWLTVALDADHCTSVRVGREQLRMFLAEVLDVMKPLRRFR